MLSEEQKITSRANKIFHMYGIFQLTIDKIVYPYGLTTSRWQVVHALVEYPKTVDHNLLIKNAFKNFY